MYKYIGVAIFSVLMFAIPQVASADVGVSNITETSFEVNWSYVPDALSYMVFWKRANEANFRQSNPISADSAATRYAITNLTPDTPYVVTIGVSTDGVSYDMQDSVSTRTAGGNAPAPAPAATLTPATSGQTPPNPGSFVPGATPTPGSIVPGNQPNPGSVTGGPTSGVFYLQNPLSPQFNTVGGLVQGFLEIFSYLVVIFAVLALIWVGLQFVLAQGNPERMKELKNWLLWIVVGLAIVIGARIIVTVVINTLQATGTVSPGVIQNANNALRGTP